VSSLGAEPDPVVIEDGARAIAFAGSLEAESLEEDLLWKGAVFENVGPGDASALTTGAKLYFDADGDGALGAGDEELGSGAFDRATREVRFQGLSRVLARGVPEPFLLVLDLKPETEGTAGGAALAIPAPRPGLLAALCLGGIVGAALSWRSGRLHRLAWAPALLLLAAFVVPAGCDGSGGGSAAASSREIRVELAGVDAVGLETGLASTPEGLPLAAWSFDA
jgi:hypothetical protein